MSMVVTRRRFLAASALVVLTMALPASAAADDPETFARSLYALPELWADVTADEDAIRKYLDPNLAALITDNYSKNDFEAALDYDPLIQAQDFDELKTKFTVDKETAGNAIVTVVVENFGETIFVTLDLSHTNDGWRLADILGPDGASLVAELKRLNANG